MTALNPMFNQILTAFADGIPRPIETEESEMRIRNYQFFNTANNAIVTITTRSTNPAELDDVEAQSLLEEMVATPEIWYLDDVTDEPY